MNAKPAKKYANICTLFPTITVQTDVTVLDACTSALFGCVKDVRVVCACVRVCSLVSLLGSSEVTATGHNLRTKAFHNAVCIDLRFVLM